MWRSTSATVTTCGEANFEYVMWSAVMRRRRVNGTTLSPSAGRYAGTLNAPKPTPGNRRDEAAAAVDQLRDLLRLRGRAVGGGSIAGGGVDGRSLPRGRRRARGAQHVVARDAAALARALHVLEVHVVLERGASHGGRGDRRARGGHRHVGHLRRRREHGRKRDRSSRRCRERRVRVPAAPSSICAIDRLHRHDRPLGGEELRDAARRRARAARCRPCRSRSTRAAGPS